MSRWTDPDPHWYDPVAVDRALNGRPVGRYLHRAERHGVVRRILAAGAGLNQVTRVLRCSGTTANRLIAEVRVLEFADLVAAGEQPAAMTAILGWVGLTDGDYDPARTRGFAKAAVELVAAHVRTRMGDDPRLWKVTPPAVVGVSESARAAQEHNQAMCQVVVRLVNGEPDVAHDMLIVRERVHGLAGLFWLGVFAVRMLAELLTTTPKEMRA